MGWTYILDVRAKRWPLQVEGPTNMTQMEGSDVTFRCRVLNDPDATIRWQKYDETYDREGTQLGNPDQQNPPAQFLENGDDPQVLTLSNIQKEDEGEYRCMAGNIHGLKHSKAWLTVIPQPRPSPDLNRRRFGPDGNFNNGGFDPEVRTGVEIDSNQAYYPEYDSEGGIYDVQDEFSDITTTPQTPRGR